MLNRQAFKFNLCSFNNNNNEEKENNEINKIKTKINYIKNKLSNQIDTQESKLTNLNNN